MAFPKTLEELVAAGYVHELIRKCTGRTCQATIEIWKTPKGKKMPLDVDDKGNVVPHWSTCKDAEEFRK